MASPEQMVDLARYLQVGSGDPTPDSVITSGVYSAGRHLGVGCRMTGAAADKTSKLIGGDAGTGGRHGI